MIDVIKRFFMGKEKPKTDFSEFFTSASSGEKKKLLREVIQDANRDQLELVERHKKMFSKVTP